MIQIHSNATSTYAIQTKEFEGKKYLVVPVVMMVEGVHTGSGGPILHTAEELGKFTSSWDGRPVTISHPKRDGGYISANSPEVLEESVGFIFHTHFDSGKLKAEAWINEEKIKARSTTALAYIRNGKPLDVSVGVFTDSEAVSGDWNGEQYEAVAHNYRPDHLALLPGEQGACSWNDGCGIRVNSNKKGGIMLNELLQTFAQLNEQGYYATLIGNEQGYNETQRSLQMALNAKDTENLRHYITEVYDNRIVYEQYNATGSGGSTLYQLNYVTNDKGDVSFEDIPVEVRRKVEYVTMEMKRTVNNNSKKGGKTMTVCCLAKIEQLIANKNSRFTEEDKEWLLAQDEATIDKLNPVEVETPQVNREEALSVLSLQTVEDYLSIMPVEMQSQVKIGLSTYEANRSKTIQSILDNSAEGVWVKEELEGLTDSTLEKLAKSIAPVDYSGQGAGGQMQVNAGEKEVLLPAGMEMKK